MIGEVYDSVLPRLSSHPEQIRVTSLAKNRNHMSSYITGLCIVKDTVCVALKMMVGYQSEGGTETLVDYCYDIVLRRAFPRVVFMVPLSQ